MDIFWNHTMLFLHVVIRYTVLSWTMCLLVISRVWLSMLFFTFDTVAWKLFLSLRSLILKMWSLEFWCISRVDLWRLLQPVVVKGFLSPVDLQISQPCKFFQPSRQKTPLFLNGLTWLWFWICYVFSTPFLSQNASQWNNSSQASTRIFTVVPRSEHQKRKPENHSMWVWFFLVLKKGVRQKNKIQKSLYFILKKGFLQIYPVLN